MKLCIIANPNIAHTQRWVQYFAGQGHQIHLISPRPLQRPVPDGVVLHDLTRQINVRKLRYPVWAYVVRRLIREIQPDLLHAHYVASSGWLGAASGFHPFLVTAYGSDLLVLARRSWLHRQLARFVLQRADYVTCVSQELAQQARLLGVAPERRGRGDPAPTLRDSAPDRLEVVQMGVDTDLFHPVADPDPIRARLNLGQGPIVLSLRAMKPVYNPLQIAQAIPLVLASIPSTRFVIRTYNADPGTLARFQALVRELGVGHAVQYVGELAAESRSRSGDDREIADYCRAADVAISIPSSDGTPQSVQEAMACGTPVILSDIPALRGWVGHEQEGLFVPPGDVPALAAAMVRLLTDRALARKLGANGAELIRQRADSRVWMRRNEEIYRRLVGSPSGGGV